MYQTKIIGKQLLQVKTDGYGDTIHLYGKIAQGETPMSLLNIALASCITMCVQGYFSKKKGIEQLDITVESRYEAENFTVLIDLPKEDRVEEIELLTYIEKHCRVKKMLREDLEISITIV